MPSNAMTPVNRINPDKLLNSKWTAVNPVNGERHFIVVALLRDNLERITGCELEAVINRKRYVMDWQLLKEKSAWQIGWQ